MRLLAVHTSVMSSTEHCFVFLLAKLCPQLKADLTPATFHVPMKKADAEAQKGPVELDYGEQVSSPHPK